jgi:hypothetical protein
MAYFSHAFQKTFVLNDDLAYAGALSNSSMGQAGFYDIKTWNAIAVEDASAAVYPKVVFAMGSYRFASDKIGTHGGYQESIKSPVIDPRLVHRLWKAPARGGQAHIVRLGWDGTDMATAPKFYCGQTYQLRIDVKGSPALRLIDHHAYDIFDVRTPCCTGDTPEPVDPVAVLLSLARQINDDAIVSKLISATVLDAGGTVNPDTYVRLTDPTDIAAATASLQLQAAYSDTDFTLFSFDPRDQYELEPVIIASAQLLDDTGDPCSLFKQLTFTEAQAPKSIQGSGHTVLREFLLDNEYRQDQFPWDERKKDIMQTHYIDSQVAANFSLYDSIYILFTIPRKYNPSGIYDNDLYLLRICAQEGMLWQVEEWLTNYMTSAGTGVVMEEE